MKHRIPAAAGAAAIAAALAATPASAHVTLQPEEAPAGGFTRLDVRVPNERDNASTTKVRVKFPPGFAFLSTEPRPGWKIAVKKRKLDTPIEAEGEKVSEEVDTVTISGGRIGPGEFADFGLSAGLPDKPGTELTFKATQTYSNGETVRWIGAPDSDEPAPQVKLVGSSGEEATAASQPASSTSQASAGDDGPSTGLVGAALVLGGLGLVAGLAALAASRRRPAA